MRILQEYLRLQLRNNEVASENNNSSTFKDDSNYQRGDSFKQQSQQLAETQKQMQLIDDFDTQKFKQKLHTISQSFNKHLQTSQQQSNPQVVYSKESFGAITKEKDKFELIKQKYQKELSKKGESSDEDVDLLDWRDKLEQIKKSSKGKSSKLEYQQKYDDAKQTSIKSKQGKENLDIKSILLKYGKNTDTFLLNDFQQSDAADNQSDALRELSFHSDLQPSESQSPRILQKQPNKQNNKDEDDEDEAFQRIKNKYLNKNSPEQKKDESLRHSSEQLFTESLSQTDIFRRSQEMINSSIDDLLSTLKNKFHNNGGGTMNQTGNSMKRNQVQVTQIKEEESFDDLSYSNYQDSQFKPERDTANRQSSNRQSINDIMKQSPKVLMKAKQETNPGLSNSSKKLRKSQEQISFPKSSENKNLLIDQFVPANFNQQTQGGPNKSTLIRQKDNMQNQQPLKEEKSMDKQTSLQRPVEQVYNQEQAIKEELQIPELLNQPSFNLLTEQSSQETFRQFESEQALEVTDKPQHQQLPPKVSKQSPYKQFKSLSKLTPMKQSNYNIMKDIPKYDQVMEVQNQQLDFGDEDEKYYKDLADIQDTLKTIKDMNLLESPEKNLHAYIKEEVRVNEGKEQQSTLEQNNEIDYNLSDSDEEDGYQHQHHQQVLPKALYNVRNALQSKKQMDENEINEEEISFYSSSEQSSVYDFSNKKNQQSYSSPPKVKPRQEHLEFRDPELYHLMNIVPLAEQRLQSIRGLSRKEEISQSLLKVNYLVERLRYLNNQWLSNSITTTQLNEQKRQIAIDLKTKEKQLMKAFKQSHPDFKEKDLALGMQQLEGIINHQKEKKINQDIRQTHQLISEYQHGIKEIEENLRIEEFDKGQELFVKVEQLRNEIGELLGSQMEDLKVMKDSKEYLDELKNKYDSKLKDINSLFIKLDNDQIILNSSEISQSIVKYFNSKSLSEYLINAILPILRNFKLQIVTSEQQFIIKLLKKDEEDDDKFASTEFLQILKSSLESAFKDNKMLSKEVLKTVIYELKAQDEEMIVELQSLNDPWFAEIIDPIIQQLVNPEQKIVSDVISMMEQAIKSSNTTDFDKWMATFSESLTDQKIDSEKLLLQTLIRYYYFQKELLKKKLTPSLKVWNQSRKLIEFLYLQSDITDDTLKLLDKIDKALIKLQSTKSIDFYDQKIHETIRSIKNLEQLENKKVSTKVQEQVSILLQTLKEFSKLCNEWMDKKYYKQRIVKIKLPEYVHLLISQIFTDINDISIDSNNELNKVLTSLQEIPSIFSNQFISEKDLQSKFKEVRKLRELKELFALGLRDIGDKVIKGDLQTFSYEEVERIVEARFERSQLRDSILMTIMKTLKLK